MPHRRHDPLQFMLQRLGASSKQGTHARMCNRIWLAVAMAIEGPCPEMYGTLMSGPPGTTSGKQRMGAARAPLEEHVTQAKDSTVGSD